MSEENDKKELSAKELIRAHKKNLARQILQGATGLTKELKELAIIDQMQGPPREDPLDENSEGIPDRLKVKRPYTMSQEAYRARRENAQKSTGPTTQEGKQRAARNNWKNGKYANTRILGMGKPCLSTCDQYPCEIVASGKTAPGELCLNKEHLVEACMAIENALQNRDQTDLNDMVVFELAESLQIIREMRRSILEDGVLVKSERLSPDGRVVGNEIKLHPAINALSKAQADFGLSLHDFNLTPKEIKRGEDLSEAAKGLADVFRQAGKQLQEAKNRKGSDAGSTDQEG